MVVYNFKKIASVPTAKDFVDVVLSKTQRQTPTVVHKQYAIGRIRSFYMRKVKFTQQAYEEKIARILDEFPRLNDIHPFYGDLINVLYDRDHYKLALGQLNMARGLIDRIGKDYLRLLKFGDSLYRCKQLKRAALGRMCTLMKKLKSSLEYLEQVHYRARTQSRDPASLHQTQVLGLDIRTRVHIPSGPAALGSSAVH
jgi:nucleolar GTP-binding protein